MDINNLTLWQIVDSDVVFVVLDIVDLSNIKAYFKYYKQQILKAWSIFIMGNEKIEVITIQ